jgi:hypothetical protein
MATANVGCRPGGQWDWYARRLLGAGLVMLLSHGPCSAQLDRQEVDRLFQSIQTSHPLVTAGDWAGCLATLDETAALAHRGWLQTNVSWFGVRMRCEARLMQSRGQPVTAETIARLTAPGLEHLARMPPGVERRTWRAHALLQGKWWLMRDLGLRDEADLEERRMVEALIDADLRGHDAAVREDMDRWATACTANTPCCRRSSRFCAGSASATARSTGQR